MTFSTRNKEKLVVKLHKN